MADITDHGIGEVLLSVDYHIVNNSSNKEFYTPLYAIDFTQNEALPIIEGLSGHNVSSTPWIGDMDNDGMLDILKSARLFSSSSCFVNLYNYFILFDNFRIFNTFFSGVLS